MKDNSSQFYNPDLGLSSNGIVFSLNKFKACSDSDEVCDTQLQTLAKKSTTIVKKDLFRAQNNRTSK